MKRLALALALSAMFTGCGAAQSATEAVSDSADRTAGAASFRMSITYNGYDTETVALDYKAGKGIVEPVVDAHPRAVLMPDAVFTELKGLAGVDPSRLGAQKWLGDEIDTASFSILQSWAVPPFAGNPRELFRLLGAVTDAEKAGEGKERGERVTRYKARLDPSRALDSYPEAERDELSVLFEGHWPEFAEKGARVEIAVDRKGRLRLIVMPSASQGEMKVEFYDYGVRVLAERPAPDEVISWDELEELMSDDF